MKPMPSSQADDGSIGDLLKSLDRQSFAVVRNFLTPKLIIDLRDDLKARKAAGEFKKAGVGKGKRFKIDPSIRGDSVLWLDPASATTVHKQLFAKIDELKDVLNKELYLGLRGFEGHYAAYPAGGKYERHRDSFKESDNRTVSFVLYLNDQWQSQWGGQLKMYDPKTPEVVAAEVEPRAGTLVVFLSSEVEHEVVAAHMERFSFTGWFLQKEPAAGVLKN
jgi:SM-20-related protein